MAEKSISNDKKELFENTPVIKAILSLAVPTIISQMINVIYNIADTFFVGRTGNPYMLAGVSLSLTVFLLTIAFANLFGIGGGSLISRMMGAGKLDDAKKISAFSFYGGLGIALFYSLVIFIFMEPILYALGASENTIVYSKQYCTWVVALGSIPLVVSSVEAHLLRNTGYSKQASFGLSGGGILNMILDPLFMFVVFPKGSEVLAAAVATFISNLAALIFLTITIIKVSRTAPLSISPKYLKSLTAIDVKNTFSVGVPSALLPGMLDVANIVLNASMAAHGDFEVAAIGIVMKLERLPNAINIGISQGMLPLVAYNFSSGNKQRMREVIKKARLMGICIAIICIGLYEIFAPQLVSVFLNTKASSGIDPAKAAADAAATLALATVFLRLRATASPVQFINYHSSYCLQAMGFGGDTLIHSFVRILIFYIPLMYVLDHFFGATGLALALTAGEFLADFVALGFLRRRSKVE